VATEHIENLSSAVEDFRRARRRAGLRELLARIRGESNELFSYADVMRQLRGRVFATPTLKEIPLEMIRGSVGRYREFTREFLPRSDQQEERWARVKHAVTGLAGLPPIDVYQIGEVYFVKDGNHRVSVAREMGLEKIEAYVTHVETPVPLHASDKPDDLIIKAEYADFLAATHLDRLRPDANLVVTVPGRYADLLEHIEVHRYYMGENQQREVSWEEAVGHWYDSVYFPVAKTIRDRGLLRGFPRRTEADLYLWITRYRSELQSELGWEISTDAAALDLTRSLKRLPADTRGMTGLRRRVLECPPGQAQAPPETPDVPVNREFQDLLVALSPSDTNWAAVDLAISIATLEDARLDGLCLVPVRTAQSFGLLEELNAGFLDRCGQAGITGRMAIEAGPAAERLSARATLADLVVVPFRNSERASRINLGSLLRDSPRPVLVATDRTPRAPGQVLVVLDGSEQSEQALYLAAYAALCWSSCLSLVGGPDTGRRAAGILARAREYLLTRDIESDDAPADFWDGSPQETLAVYDLTLTGTAIRNPKSQLSSKGSLGRLLSPEGCPVLICT
jgi:hypothetical protein